MSDDEDDEEGAESAAPGPDAAEERRVELKEEEEAESQTAAEPDADADADGEASQHPVEAAEQPAESAQSAEPTVEPAAEPEASAAAEPDTGSDAAADVDANADSGESEAEAAESDDGAAEPHAALSGPETQVIEPVPEPETEVIKRVEPDTEPLPSTPPAFAATTPATEPTAPPDRSNRTLLVFGAIIAAVLIIGALGAVLGSVARHSSGSGSNSGGPGGTGTAAITIPANGVSVVQLDGVAGKVTVNTASTSSISISAGSPILVHELDNATHTLDLTCSASGGDCPASTFTVTIPQHVGLTLHEVSGQASLNGISGPVSITANAANTTATGLTATDFTAVITNGELDAAFTGVPRRVSVSVISSQATLHLPGSAQYAVDEQIISGNASVQVPRVASSPNVVEANVTSGAITLLAD